MPHGHDDAAIVPKWVGFVGFVLVVIFAFSAFTNSVWFMFLALVACFVIVIVENRYERGLWRG